jgi:hypothetical protein
MRWTRWISIAAVTACTGEPELASRTAPISGGSDDTLDVAVVGIVDSGSGATCTGSLVAPDLVITAQHCVAQPAGIGMCDQGMFGPARAPADFFVTTRPTLTLEPSDYHGVVEIVIPPGGGFCGRDLALLRLADQVTAAEAAPIAPRLEPPPAPGEIYAAVGFGAVDDNGTGSGQRRRRDGLAVACVGAACASAFLGDAEWRGEAGTCIGDSGGPALDGAGRVVGVVSRGSFGCVDPVHTTIASHAAWLVAEAIRIAGLGGYPPPAWTGAGPPIDAAIPDAATGGDSATGADAATTDGDGGGCQAAPGAGGGLFLMLALTRISPRRSRRRT